MGRFPMGVLDMYFFQTHTGVREKQPLQKFDAKTSFEVWIIVSDVFFREASAFEVKNMPKPQKQQQKTCLFDDF